MCKETAGNIAYNHELHQVLASLSAPTVSINERYVGKSHVFSSLALTGATGEGDEIIREAMARAVWTSKDHKK
jgi:hypothetical protein